MVAFFDNNLAFFIKKERAFHFVLCMIIAKKYMPFFEFDNDNSTFKWLPKLQLREGCRWRIMFAWFSFGCIQY